MPFYQKSNSRKQELPPAAAPRPLDAPALFAAAPARTTPKLVRDTPEGHTKINAAITMLMVWALEHDEPWSIPDPDSEVA